MGLDKRQFSNQKSVNSYKFDLIQEKASIEETSHNDAIANHIYQEQIQSVMDTDHDKSESDDNSNQYETCDAMTSARASQP